MADPAAPPPPDWEVLSLSMSASASFVCACDSCTGLHSGNRNCTKQPSSSASLGLNFDPLPVPVVSSDLRVVNAPIPPVITARVEPFTEGWKPLLRSAVQGIPDHASSLGSDQSPFEGAYPERTCSSDENTEPFAGFQKELFMAGQDLTIAQAYAGERILASPNADDADKLPKRKARKAQGTRKSTVVLSIALATTVLGIVIIGQRWQLEQQQNQQLRLELGAKEQKLNHLMYQINRLKEVLTGPGSFLQSSIFSSITDW